MEYRCDSERGGRVMSQYKRIVSYIYQYINGEKGRNTGYVRLESRDNVFRITAQIKLTQMKFLPKLWLFKQYPTGIEYTEVCKGAVKSGNACYKAVSEVDNVCGSGYRAQDFDGAVLFVSNQEYYATSWNNDMIYLGEKIDLAEKNREEKQGSLYAAESENQDSVIGESEENDDANIEISEKENLSSASIEQDCINGEEKICDYVQNDNFNNEKKDFAARMFEQFPVMYPFSSGKIQKSVRIEPKDIGCMPIRMWSLTNNGFLLHGYYCYKHLLFAELADGRYAVGVPGIYDIAEKNTAQEFLFTEFQPIGSCELLQGAFGYWLRELS